MFLRKRCPQVTCFVALGLAVIACEAIGGEQPALWKIQKLLASKKYVDLTHEFAPGIPRWPGFPDETRKTIYWYDKRPDCSRIWIRSPKPAQSAIITFPSQKAAQDFPREYLQFCRKENRRLLINLWR